VSTPEEYFAAINAETDRKLAEIRAAERAEFQKEREATSQEAAAITKAFVDAFPQAPEPEDDGRTVFDEAHRLLASSSEKARLNQEDRARRRAEWKAKNESQSAQSHQQTGDPIYDDFMAQHFQNVDIDSLEDEELYDDDGFAR
jgi:hypothetical protein